MRKLFIAVMISAMGYGAPAQNAPIEIVVDLNFEHQIIDNFGASDCWSMQMIGGWRLENRNRIADLLFSTAEGIGLSCWRFNIGAGKNVDDIHDAWRTAETFEVGEGRYDWSRQSREQWFLGAAKARGVEQFVAFANSPPARMTKNGLTHCSDGSGSTNLKEGFEGQYARYLADILEHFRNNPDESLRIDFDRISPVNEPQWDWNDANQEGNRAGNGDIKKIIAALYGELQRRGLKTQILAPESGSIFGMRAYELVKNQGQKRGNYLEMLCSDPELPGRLGNVVCSHAYWADKIPELLVPQRIKFRQAFDKYPDWRYWMSEYSIMQGTEGQGGGGRDLTMKTALDVARVIHCDLTLCNASAWQWWLAVSRWNYKDGLIYTDYVKEGDPESILPSKTLWAFGNYSRFVRPGAKRIALTGADDIHGLLGSAYKNAASSQAIMVFINMAERPESVSLHVAGLSPNQKILQFTPYLTSENANLQAGSPVPSGTPYTVPAQSVVTLIGEINAM